MGRIKILLMSLVVIMAGCDDEVIVDGPAKGEWYFTIANSTSHNVKIETSYNKNEKENHDTIFIAPYDSITRPPGTISAFEYYPFNSYCTYLIFDDTLSYLCEAYLANHEDNHDQMVKQPSLYKPIEWGPEVYHLRYEITEEKYQHVVEHLKKHNCKEECEKTIASK
jgi:hypothetical protein